MVSFFVEGTPRPKGSVNNYGRGKYAQQNAHLLEPWQKAIGWAAKAARVPLVTGPVRIRCEFIFDRPKAHFVNGDGVRLKPSAPRFHMQAPDADKLLRAVLDALTKIAWADDKQVVDPSAPKRWAKAGQRAGVRIEIETLNDEREVA